MTARQRKAKVASAADSVCLHEVRPYPWLEIALAGSAISLLLQIFPGVWWSTVSVWAVVLSYLDVRGWTWRSYATVSGIAMVTLAIIKAWRDNAWSGR
jgi:hypothetical protein